MKKIYQGIVILTSILLLMGWNSAKAQDKFTVTGKAEFVSNYVWRGSDQNSGFSLQPSLGFAYKGLSLSAFGSQSLTNAKEAPQEFDINLGYSIKGFSILLSDYWWDGMAAAYGNYSKGHHFEATLSYSFAHALNFPLTLSWSTLFAGFDDFKARNDGTMERAYSTYISAWYDFKLPYRITLTPQIGFTPWEGMYNDKAAFTDFSLKAVKEIAITEKFCLPLFVQLIVAPHDQTRGVDKTYLIAGFSFGF